MSRIPTSGRIAASGRVASSNRVSSVSREGFMFTLIGNGLQAFYRPDAGTVKLIGGKVSSVADLSGNNHTMTQSSSSRRPNWNLNSLNGMNSLSFSGSQWLQSDLIQTLAKPWTMGGVFKATNTAS